VEQRVRLLRIDLQRGRRAHQPRDLAGNDDLVGVQHADGDRQRSLAEARVAEAATDHGEARLAALARERLLDGGDHGLDRAAAHHALGARRDVALEDGALLGADGAVGVRCEEHQLHDGLELRKLQRAQGQLGAFVCVHVAHDGTSLFAHAASRKERAIPSRTPKPHAP